MKNHLRTILVALALLACAVIAESQQTRKVPRIGFVSAVSASSIAARLEGFRLGLREHGYVEGKTIVIDARYADGEPHRLAALAAELARLKVDVIVTTGPSSTRAAKEATNTIPIVMAQDADPVGSGFVANLA